MKTSTQDSIISCQTKKIKYMKIRINKSTGRLEIRTEKRMIAFSCDILKGSYYLVPTVRFDTSRAYVEKSFWFLFLCAFVLIDIFKIKD